MTTKRDELKALLLQALDEPVGVIFKVQSNRKGARTLDLAALAAAKRELMIDEPKVLDLACRPVPGTADEIAIIRMSQDD